MAAGRTRREFGLQAMGALSAVIVASTFCLSMATAGFAGLTVVLTIAFAFMLALSCSDELPGRMNIEVNLQEVAVVGAALLAPLGHVIAGAVIGNLVNASSRRIRPAKVVVSSAMGLFGAVPGAAVVTQLASPLPDRSWALAALAGGATAALCSSVAAHGFVHVIEGRAPSDQPVADVLRDLPVGVVGAAVGALFAIAATVGNWVWPLVAVAGAGVGLMFVLMRRAMRSSGWFVTLTSLRELIDTADGRTDVINRSRPLIRGILDGYETTITDAPMPGARYEMQIDSDLRVVITQTAHPKPLGADALAFLSDLVTMLSTGLRAIDERHTLAVAATTDPLTGLGNRRSLEALVHDRRRLGVVLFDINNFKALNDFMGHAAGDDMLRWIAKRVRDSIRDGDLVARLGGDEFVVVTEPTSLEALVDRLRTSLAAPPAPAQLHVSLSFGAAASGQDGGMLDELLAAADARMYEEKRTAPRPASHPR